MRGTDASELINTYPEWDLNAPWNSAQLAIHLDNHLGHDGVEVLIFNVSFQDALNWDYQKKEQNKIVEHQRSRLGKMRLDLLPCFRTKNFFT